MNDNSGDTNGRIVKTVCSLCQCSCGVLAYVEDGNVIDIKGDPDHPNNKGALCPKGLAGIELLYHPARLNYPLKRVGKKGDGKWQKISWDEALDSIAHKLSDIKHKYGPEAITVTRGAALYSNMGFIGYISYLLGTPNTMSSSFICFQPQVAAARATIGYPQAIHATEVVFDEVLNSNCILLWGANPRNAAPYPVGEGIFKVKEQGAKLIVVDPRPTDYAKVADIWLRLRPATDDAVALGMINVIINEQLYDREFVSEWTHGFEDLRKHVQDYTPEHVSQISWVPREDIVAAARIFASTRPSCVCQRVALDQNCNAVQTSRAILILNAICGNYDIKGGNPLPTRGKVINEGEIFSYVNKLPRNVLEKRIGAKEFPLLSGPDAPSPNVHPTLWAQAILKGTPYPVKALITSARNWIMGDQNAKLIQRVIKELEFSVTVDLFMTPTAELSDVVLPAACWLERDGFRGHHGFPYVTSVQHRAIEPLYDRWDDIQFFIELAKKMDLDIHWDNVEEYMDYRLNGMGISFKELEGVNSLTMPKEYERHRKGKFEFKTPSKKVELHSSLMQELGYDPLPHFKAPPEITSDFPLILIGGRKKLEYVHSAGRQIASLRERAAEPIIEINPDTAKNMGISEDDWVWVETIYFREKEQVRFRARFVKDLHPNVIAVDHGWWFPEQNDPYHGCFKSNINVVIPADVYDPMFGSSNLRSIPARVYKSA